MMRRFYLLPTLFFISFLTQTNPSLAQFGFGEETDKLKIRVQQLEQDLAVLRGDAGDGGTSPLLQLNQRIDRLEHDLRQLTGSIEKLQYENDRNNNERQKLIDGFAHRLSLLEGTTPPTAIAITPPTPVTSDNVISLPQRGAAPASLGTLQATPPPTTPIAESPKTNGGTDDFEQALATLRGGSFEDAQKRFQVFLEASPNHPKAGDASYWLGETYYVRGQYDKAARQFLEGFSKYPKSPKGPDGLLKLGMTLAQLKQKDEACQSFSEIKTRYPQASDGVLKRAGTESKRLHCP